jgi:acetoin utilization protein AcuB
MAVYVRNRMATKLYTVGPEATALETLELMQDKKIKRVPVLKNGKLVGIVTERNLLEAMPRPVTSINRFDVNTYMSKLKIDSVMTKNVVTVTSSTLLEAAALKMREYDISGLPVVDDEKLVGIITKTDIFDSFIEIMGLKDYGSRITVEISEDRPGVLAHVAEIIAAKGINITHLAVHMNEIIIRVNTVSLKDILEELRKSGYKVVSVLKTEQQS